MPLTKEQLITIEKKAHDELINAYRNEETLPPIDLGKVITANDMHLFRADFSNSEVLGMLYRSRRDILYDRNLSFPRMAFTIAHEFGHYILHEEMEKDIHWRTESINLDDQSNEECEANWFAACILMPRGLTIKCWSFIKDIEKIARIFHVSQTVATWRLKNIGLIQF